MAGDWDVCPFYPASYMEPEMDQKYFQKEAHAFFYPADNPCHLCLSCNGGFPGKRRDPLPSCACIFADCGRAFFCQEPSHGFGILGICISFSPFGIPLEHDHGDDEKAFEKNACRPGMDIAGNRFPDSRLWGVCFLEKRNLGIYVL